MRITSRLIFVFAFVASTSRATLIPTELRTDWLTNPAGVEDEKPHLSWRVESRLRGDRQSAYRLIVASDLATLARDEGDLWETGKVAGNETLNIAYDGKPLASGQRAFWKLKVWDKDNRESQWSDAAHWSATLKPNEWRAQWISYKDNSPLHTSRDQLFLPAARHYRKSFVAEKAVKRATVYASALGIYDLHCNGKRADDAYFAPGWSDYRERAYYRAHDVTALIQHGENVLGAIVADGWYAGYVGYGLLVGYGPNKVGRYFYGKTPALLVQLEIEYQDGTRASIVTDRSWQVSGDGPFREADMIMGESYDARRAREDWCSPGGAHDWQWDDVVEAAQNPPIKATFSDTLGSRAVELGFQKPKRMQVYSAPPVRVTQEISARTLTETSPGVFLFDLGQNFAGNIRLRVNGSAGTRLQIRYGEMRHPDGRLMTENLRRARATDFYTLRGGGAEETWTPRFTYHGFRFVEISGLSERLPLDAVTGLVIHNDTPLTSHFACNDPIINRLFQNIVWTQRANFIEVPTDCPQRDERLGWMGDAQMFARAATFNADVAAFFTKWLDDVEEAQRDFGAYPDYSPYPMAHGEPGKTFAAAWTDAGIICPWTMWRVYGDTRLIGRHWSSMKRFMDWRRRSAPDLRGTNEGNKWGDWLNTGEITPIEYIDICYHALDARLMAEMATALGREDEGKSYAGLFNEIRNVFQKEYLVENATLRIETQTAYALALAFDLLPPESAPRIAERLAERIKKNGFRMATGFVGTKPLLPVLSAAGHHELALRLFQSREFPSWGYEVVNGATTVWERWDSFTKSEGFGRHNAAMNSFSHYAFGAVCEWMFRFLAGIDEEGGAYQRLRIAPGPPLSHGDTPLEPIYWVKADYKSPRGTIATEWRHKPETFELFVSIPANATADLYLPAKSEEAVREGGKPVRQVEGVKFVRMEGSRAVLFLESGNYHFTAALR